jgi:hypothetical protein
VGTTPSRGVGSALGAKVWHSGLVAPSSGGNGGPWPSRSASRRTLCRTTTSVLISILTPSELWFIVFIKKAGPLLRSASASTSLHRAHRVSHRRSVYYGLLQ